MSNAYTRYTGDGVNATFAVPFKYLDKEDIQVHVNGQPVGYTWLSAALLTTEAPPAYGAIVEVRRYTNEEPRAVDFTNGSILTDTDLDTANDQPIYIAQESIDKTERCLQRGWDDSYDFESHPLRNIPQPTQAGDPVRLGDLQAWAPGGQTPSVLPDGPGAITRTFDDIARDEVNVLSFIPAEWRDAIRARTTQNDVSVYVQKAIDYVYSLGGGELYFPRGLYLCHNLVAKSHVRLRGAGRFATIIKLADGSNCDLIVSDGFSSLTGGNTTLGVEYFELLDMTLDGNRAKNTAGRCIAYYGQKPTFSRLYVCNAPDTGIHTEWGIGGESDFGMEGSFLEIRVDRSGEHGWKFAGPHDSTFKDVIIIDASLKGTNLFHNLYVTGNSNGRFYGVHCWQRGASPRSAYAARLEGFGANNFDGCHFEGAVTPLGIFSVSNTFSPSCRFYAASGGPTIYLGGIATENMVHGFLGEVNPGYPPPYGIQFGSGDTDYIASNSFNLITHLQNAGQVNYGNKSGGNNSIIIRGYAADGYDWVGSPHPSDAPLRDIVMTGPVSSLHNTSHPGRVLASVVFNTGSGAIESRSNVTSVAKIGKGSWRLNFQELIPNGAVTVASCSTGPGPGFNIAEVPSGNADYTQDITIFNTSTGALNDDPCRVSVIVVGQVTSTS